MKVLLVNPTAGPDVDYGTLSRASTDLPQVGLAFLATVLVEHEHDVEIVDKTIHCMDDEGIVNKVLTDRIEVVGLSVYVTTKRRALQLAEKIKAASGSCLVVVGGPEATLDPESLNHPAIDYVFVGEADESLVEVLEALKDGKLTRPVAGVLERSGTGLRGDSEKRLVPDLNRLPSVRIDRFYSFERSHPPIHILGNKVVNMMTVRGCPFPCTFCAAGTISGRKLRTLSPERVVTEVKYYLDRGFDSLCFYDDTFTLDKERVRKLCKLVLQEGLRFHWNCFTRVDCVDPETLALMREAGCYLVVFGVESLNPKTLRKLRKGFEPKQVLSAIRLVKSNGMAAQASFMIGLPGETRADIENTIAKAVETPLDFALFPVFEPYRGTPIYEDCVREGHWTKMGSDVNALLIDQEEVWVPNTCTREEIIELSRKAMRRFYLRPSRIMRLLRWVFRLPASRWWRCFRFAYEYFVALPLSRKERGVDGARFR
jgi:radical SAM superfamily enzyme YgiQ (UPF0313 family)